jgi:arylsulfatase A-like enzyme
MLIYCDMMARKATKGMAITRRSFLSSVVSSAGAAAGSGTVATAAVAAAAGVARGAQGYGSRRRPPNLVFMMSDDMGYADLGCYGSRDIRTPHLDSLARDGVRFTDCYSNAAVCTPTRVALLTGCYQQRFGSALESALGPATNFKVGLEPKHAVLPGALKQAGYRTGIFGKWHVGAAPQFRPTVHGWDESFGILLGNADMFTHRYHDGSHDLWHNGKPVQQKGYLTELLAARAAEWVEQNVDRPFLLYLPFNAVHWPFQYPGEEVAATAENWRDGTRDAYRRMLESMDGAVGHVLDALRRRGLEENTLVFFTNDNGGERLSDSGPLFHVKGTLWEGGIRVPALARWPGMIPAQQTTSQVAATMDFTATMLAAAQARLPEGKRLDGVNLLPVLTGKQQRPMERPLFWRIESNGRRQLAARRGRWKYLDDNTGNRNLPELLFDLEADPGERRNLYYDNQELAASMRAAALAWVQNVEHSAKLNGA